MNQEIEHIFFDLDHTLWDFDRNSELAFAAIFSDDFPTIAINDFIQVYVPINQECWRLYQSDQISHHQLRYNRLKQSFDAINFNASDADIDHIANKYLALLPTNNLLLDGTIQVLEYLQKSYQLHIITNGFADVQERKLLNSGLKPFFRTITNSEDAGCKKPNSLIFETALGRASASKNNAIMVGDSWEADVLGALNFGIGAIYFNPENLSVKTLELPLNSQKFFEINQLQELTKLL